MNNEPYVYVVYEGKRNIEIPPILADPRPDQLIGTPLEQLAELCGRICYDSLGIGRSSADFHNHIIEVKHLSIWEHGHVTFQLMVPEYELSTVFQECLNRPGVFVTREHGYVYITLNMRALYEWDEWSKRLGLTNTYVGNKILEFAHTERIAPQLLQHVKPYETKVPDLFRVETRVVDQDGLGPREQSAHLWLSVYIGNVSRGLSHELVRHGDFTAISQRSTRYCNEFESEWVKHPLLVEYLLTEQVHRAPNGEATELSLRQVVDDVEHGAKQAYKEVVDKLQIWLEGRGADLATARKQARGAARGYLGNALSTELIFSASCAQWRNILLQRGNPAADAEIRNLAVDLLLAFRRTTHRHFFKNLEIYNNDNGMGAVIIETGL